MKKRTRVTNGSQTHISRLVQVARAYYVENQIQSEIARSLGISRSLVSRYLTAARDQGIVRIQIVDPSELSFHSSALLKQQFPHLKDVIVAPSFSHEPDASRAMIGRYAAHYLVDILQPAHTLALGCGRTLRAMVDALQKRTVPDTIIVQAMGNIGHEAHNIDYNEIALHAGNALGGRVYYVSAPAILGKGSNSAEEFVRANSALHYSLTLAKHADIYMVGIGSFETDQLYVRTGLLEEAELDDLQQRAVGDICGHFFNADGEEQDFAFTNRIVGIQLEDLKRAQYSIGVAGGVEKVPAIYGALKGEYINVLISDEHTVQSLLRMIE